MMIDHDASIDTSKHPFVVLIGGATIFTLVINGTTTGWFLNKLGLLNEPTAGKMLGQQATVMVHKAVKDEFNKLCETDAFPHARPEAAGARLWILGSSWLAEKKTYQVDDDGAMANALAESERPIVSYRTIYLEMVRAEYWRVIRMQLIPVTSTLPNSLLSSIDIALDEVDTKLDDWSILRHSLSSSCYNKCVVEGGCLANIMRLFGRLPLDERNTYLTTTYITCHKLAFDHFESLHMKLHQKHSKTKAGQACSQFSERAAEAFEELKASHEELIGKAQSARLVKDESLCGSKTTDQLLTVMHTKMLAITALNIMHHKLEELSTNAQIPRKRYEMLERTVNDNISQIQQADPDDILDDSHWDPAFRFSESATIQLDQLEKGKGKSTQDASHEQYAHNLENQTIPALKQQIENLRRDSDNKEVKIHDLREHLATSNNKVRGLEAEVLRLRAMMADSEDEQI